MLNSNVKTMWYSQINTTSLPEKNKWDFKINIITDKQLIVQSDLCGCRIDVNTQQELRSLCLIIYYPVKLFCCVMHNFRHFLPVLWHYRRHVHTIMQHYMPIKLWTVIAAKTIVHDDKAANMRRYIAADNIMLHNVV